jgi:hypothetical protein
MLRILSICIALFVLACSSAEPIAPESADNETRAHTEALSASITRTVPLAWHSNDDWIADTNGGVVRRVPCGQAEPDLATWSQDIDAATLPHGARLEALWLSIAPCDGDRSALPGNMPVLAANLVDSEGVIVATLGAIQDQSQTTAEYTAAHRIMLPVFALQPLDRALHRVVVRFENEYAVDALSGMRIVGMRVRYAPP